MLQQMPYGFVRPDLGALFRPWIVRSRPHCLLGYPNVEDCNVDDRFAPVPLVADRRCRFRSRSLRSCGDARNRIPTIPTFVPITSAGSAPRCSNECCLGGPTKALQPVLVSRRRQTACQTKQRTSGLSPRIISTSQAPVTWSNNDLAGGAAVAGTPGSGAVGWRCSSERQVPRLRARPGPSLGQWRGPPAGHSQHPRIAGKAQFRRRPGSRDQPHVGWMRRQPKRIAGTGSDGGGDLPPVHTQMQVGIFR
jgi:hypothetical protein